MRSAESQRRINDLDWSSPTVPEPEACVLGPLLGRHAQQRPDAVFAVFDDGEQWTYADAWREANAAAAELRSLGVGHGDCVLSWLVNGPAPLRVWFGANLLGAVYVPLNTSYRGRLLHHAVQLAGAGVLVADQRFVERLGDVRPEQIVEPLPAAPAAVEDVVPEQPVQPWDPYAFIYTSGTTGPSKAVVCPYVHLATTSGIVAEQLGANGRYMVNLPLFHAGGTIGVYAALLVGGSIAVVESFDTARFWDSVRETGTTHVTLLGVMATFLAKQPPSPADRDHSLRRVYMVPLNGDPAGFAQRFGVSVVTLFNMTETSIPLLSEVDPATPGTCGRVRRGVDARLVDEHDREVPDGEVGELILRTDRPWAMNAGYHGMPEATAQAWRNGWFHTGDAFRRIDDEYFFVDRMKDAIRRRGENISSFEVEAEVVAHPAVAEAAVVAVPSVHGEDDVLAVVAPVDGQQLDPAQLIAFLTERMAHFMVPRYVRILPELPKTPTSKVEKHVLRDQGLTADTWDRDAAGISIRRERIGGQP